jgi:hypothetical protein
VQLILYEQQHIYIINIITDIVPFTDENIGHPMKTTGQGQKKGHEGGTVIKFYTQSPKAQ